MAKRAKRDARSYTRTTGNKEATVNSSASYLLVSFAHLQQDLSSGFEQSFVSWEQEGLLSKLMEKIKHLNKLTLREAMNQQIIAEYKDFPAKSEFSCPKPFVSITRWGVIKNIGGQKPRVAGFFDANVFHCVFFDKDHQFYPVTKRHT